MCSEGLTKAFSLARANRSVNLTELSRLRGGLGTDINPDGKWVASGGYSGNVHVSDLRTGGIVKTLVAGGEDGSVWDVKFFPKDTRLAIGGMSSRGPGRSGIVQIWDLREQVK